MKKTLLLTLALALVANMLFGAWVLWQDFEHFDQEGFPPSGWARGPNSANNYNWVSLTGGPSVAAGSRSSVADVAPFTPDNWLISPVVDLGNASDMVKNLQFDYSSQNAVNYLTIYMTSVNTGNLTADFVTDGITLFDGNMPGAISPYVHETLPLSAYTGQVRFAFRHHNCTGGGWALVDNIGVWLQYDIDLATTSFTSSASSLDLDVTPTGVTISAIITNYGLQSASGYTISLNRLGGATPITTWSDGTAIAAGATRTITHTYIPPVGTAVLDLTLSFIGDEYPANNNPKTITFTVFHGNSTMVQPLNAYPAINPASNAFVPAQLYYELNMSQSLYTSTEMGGQPRTLTSLAWSFITNSGGYLSYIPLQVYIGHTNKTQFDDENDWVAVNNQTLVFDGYYEDLEVPANDPNGADLWIPFIAPFAYNGTQNLIVTYYSGDETGAWAGSAFSNAWFMAKTLTSDSGGTNRSIYLRQDGTVININNPGTGTRTDRVPVIRFELPSTVTTVELYGLVVQSNGSPIVGATVGRLDNPLASVVTNEYGEYSFPNFNIDNDGLYATLAGYQVFNSPPLTTDDVDDYGDSWEYNIFMTILPTYAVSGTIKSGYNNQPLEDVEVVFHHPTGVTFSATTDAAGLFTLNLTQNTTYAMTITTPLYQTYTAEVPVAEAAVPLGNILLIEKPLQPIMLKATAAGPGKVVSWLNPYTPNNTFTYAPSSGSLSYLSIGTPPVPFTAFSRFSVADMLADLPNDGSQRMIYRVAFVPGVAVPTATYTITIVHFPTNMASPPAADYPVYNTGTVLYTQPVEDYQIVLEQWCYVDLDNAVDLSTYTTGQIWVGIAITNSAGTYPMGAANTGPNTYCGDIYYLPNTGAYNQLGTQGRGNWMLATYTVDVGIPPTSPAPITITTPSHVFGEISDIMAESSGLFTQIEPLRIVNNHNNYRALTNYELYRIPTTLYNTPITTWGAPIAGNLTGADMPYYDTLVGGPGTSWVYALVAVYNAGNADYANKSAPIYSSVQSPVTEDDVTAIPMVTALKTNYPNPFNPSTTIAFDVAKEGKVCIEVFNIKGQKVKTIVNETYGVGKHSVVWNGDDLHGRSVGSGVYFYRMTSGDYNSVRKMILMK